MQTRSKFKDISGTFQSSWPAFKMRLLGIVWSLAHIPHVIKINILPHPMFCLRHAFLLWDERVGHSDGSTSCLRKKKSSLYFDEEPIYGKANSHNLRRERRIVKAYVYRTKLSDKLVATLKKLYTLMDFIEVSTIRSFHYLDLVNIFDNCDFILAIISLCEIEYTVPWTHGIIYPGQQWYKT